MSADLPVLLAGGVEPKDASPGIGAFIAFLILALVIILLAWSFTRHQRRIRTNAAREAAAREAAGQEADAEEVDAEAAAGTAESGQPADEHPEAGEQLEAGEQPGAQEREESAATGSSPPAAGEGDGGGQR